MGRPLSAASGKNVRVSRANAIIRGTLTRSAGLDAVVQGTLVQTAALNASIELFTRHVLNAGLNAAINPATTLLNGLAGYWKLDGNSNDSLGSANGVDTNITYASGKIGQGATFPVGGSKIVLGTTGQLNFTDLTLSAWVLLSSTANFYSIFSKGYDGSTNFHWMTYPGGTMYLLGNGNGGVSATTTLTTGVMTHVAVSRTAAGATKFYINGGAAGTGNGPAAATGYTLPNHIGSRADAYSVWPGTIDEVGAWNRVLTDAEVVELYNAGAGKSYPF